MALVVTDLGRERIMTHFVNGTELDIDSIQVGTLNAADRYDAAATAVALTDATPTTYAGQAPMLSGVSAQYNVQLSGADEVVASEVGLFEGTNLIILWADASDDLFTKPANGNVLFAVGWSLASGMISDVSVTVQAFPISTEPDSRALSRNDVLMTPLQVSYALDEFVPGDATTGARGFTQLATAAQRRAVQGGADPAANIANRVLTLQTLFDTIKVYSEVPAVTATGTGSGAEVSSIEVNSSGQITDVVWADGGTGYATGDVLTFTQGNTTGTYTLLAADRTGGELQDLTGKSIGTGDFIASLPATVPDDGTIELVLEA